MTLRASIPPKRSLMSHKNMHINVYSRFNSQQLGTTFLEYPSTGASIQWNTTSDRGTTGT